MKIIVQSADPGKKGASEIVATYFGRYPPTNC